jgi:hypothetical protein
MAESFPLEDLNRTHAFEDVDDLKELETIFNDSSYDTVTLDNFRLEQSEKPNINQITDELKVKITNENINKLKALIELEHPNINKDFLLLKLNELRTRIVSKDGDLYLRDSYNPKAKPVRFGKSQWKVIKLTQYKGKHLLLETTLTRNGLKTTDPLYELLTYTDETSFIKDAQGDHVEQTSQPQFNIYTSENETEAYKEHITQMEIEKRNKAIENVEKLMTGITSVRDDIKDLYNKYKIISSDQTIPKSVIEEGIRPLLQAEEMKNILSDEERQLITKYLDFIEKNKEKTIQLQADIKWLEKEIQTAENQLLSETNEDQKAVLKQFIDSNKAKIITSQKLLDQILIYNEKQYIDINTRLKSKFTLREKLGYIFKKYGLTITATTLALGLIIDTIVTSVRGTPNITPSPSGNTNLPNKVKQSLKNFSNWLLEMSKKALDNLPAIIGSIISFLLKTTASIVGFLAEHIILFVIALAFALYEALKIGYNDIKRRQ